MCLCFFASAAKGAPASPTVTSAAIASLVVIMVGPFPRLDRDKRTVCHRDHFNVA
jgi:hypothetical protein